MPRRLYFDTSVFGGVFDDEFRNESIQLFEQVKRGRVVCLYSETVERELSGASGKVRKILTDLPKKQLKVIKTAIPIVDLAEEYIVRKIVERTSHDDCLHVAAATVYQVDVLVSWDFKHIVNPMRIKLFNSVNLRFGYKELKIYSPRQLLSYEKEKERL